ncbi:T9SS type A sorting domain-containing protein [bacterium]|nr:T9SS type A sorting domain-containing protein [bacterium]
MMRITLTALVLILGLCATAHAVPQPWIVSNIGADGNGTRLYDTSGQLLEGDILVEYYVDREGDGIDPVLSTGRNTHPDTGDDSLLVSTVFSMPQAGFLPRGSFAFFFTVDTESAAQLEMNTFVRVYNSDQISQESWFTTSTLFTPGDGVSLGQTRVELPTGMYGYLDNEPPEVTLLPLAGEPIGGETFHFELQVDDDEVPVFFEALLGVESGEVSLSMIETGVLAGSWDVPLTFAGEFTLPIVVSDGQFFDTTMVELDILPAGARPAVFDLLYPKKDGPAFSGMPLQWEETAHPDGGAIEYHVQWSTGTNFIGGSWIDGISEPQLTLTFSEAVPDHGDGELGRLRNRGNDESLNPAPGFASDGIPGETELDEYNIQLPLTEGTRFIWRVRAEAEDGSYRYSSDVYNAWAEFADAPTVPSLLLPENDAELEDSTPSFSWQASSDPDLGDELVYDLLITADEGTTWDTIHVGQDTSWQMEETDLVTLIRHSMVSSSQSQKQDPAGKRDTRKVRESDGGEAGGSSTATSGRGKKGNPVIRTLPDETEVYDLPQDLILGWKVDAVDLAGLRTGSPERTLTVVIPDRPTHFDLVSPAPGTTFRGMEPVVLRWTTSIDADPDQDVTYSVFGARITPDVPDPVQEYFAEELTGTEWTLEMPDGQRAEWRWQVIAIAGEDTVISNGGPSHFYIRPVYTPELLGPVDDTVIEEEEFTFTWTYPAGWQEDVTSSRLEVFDHPSLIEPVLESDGADTFHVATVDELPTSEYWWTVTALETNGSEWTVAEAGHFIVPLNSLSVEELVLPEEFGITNAYPNPFNAAVTVVIAIPHQADVRLSVYDLLGREVISQRVGNLQPGYRPVYLDFTGYATGTYLVRLHAKGLVDKVQRIVLVK